MDKRSIIDSLIQRHEEFGQYLASLSKEDFEINRKEKWSAGQDLDHILKSIKPLSEILSNKEFIAAKFGKGNGTSSDYENLVRRYKGKLTEGGTAFGNFIPEKINWSKKADLLQLLHQRIEKITESLRGYTEEELDELLLPHPLLGALTVREMLYFTNYHVVHHQSNIIRNLKSVDNTM
ncbi:DinB family protein [Muricauda sp. JGD-17]|uniref:DinB family protein n=1 Tax=Flagellimonas ochracea TaxID=2696472 RepID=A0A964TC58_9FLAO|nr:DinB family protein [Allomuricauda ochracea]NAY92179.1 DinB family protein [Allomuricauda ochracea]